MMREREIDCAKSAKGLKSDCVLSSVCCVRSAGKEDILSFPVGVSGEWRIFPGILCTGVFLDAIALPASGFLPERFTSADRGP